MKTIFRTNGKNISPEKKIIGHRALIEIEVDDPNTLNPTRTVNFIGLSRFLQTVSSYQENRDNVEIGTCPFRSTRK